MLKHVFNLTQIRLLSARMYDSYARGLAAGTPFRRALARPCRPVDRRRLGLRIGRAPTGRNSHA